MAIALVSQEWTGTHYAAELQCDTVEDVAKLPEFAKKYKIGLGSNCLVVDTAEVYSAKSDGTWKAL